MISAGESLSGAADRRARSGERFDAARARRDFPLLRDSKLVYLDSAASAQKPQCVIDAIANCYSRDYANIHRGVYELSARATANFEATRAAAQRFIGAADPSEIVFVRNATEAINLVAASYGRSRLRAGDEVLITAMEHHSNIVPWQMLCEEKGARLVVAPIDDRGALILEEFAKRLGARTKIVAVAQISNALGTVNPVAEIAKLAHEHGAVVAIDGAQAVPHQRVDVSRIDCDFYAFSSHKMFGPTGVGVLYGKRALLDAMPPYQGGGSMIQSVTFEKTLYAESPMRFEAGTPDIGGVAGFGAALDYLGEIGLAAVEQHERELLAHATAALAEVPGLRLIGTAPEKAAVLSFTIDGVHPHDVGSILDHEGIAVRSGHHCAQPVMARFGVPATVRASLALYNTREDIDALVAALHTVRELFR
ncbi:MAG TPA: cysteine desulfurase [Myxococcota bacterium]|nr:cysteine desulfurase [Myxococcota bacterium]